MSCNRAAHEANVRMVAKTFDATIEIAGNGHFKIEGKGWRVYVPSTPRCRWDEVRIRKHIVGTIFKQACEKASRIGKK